MDILDPCDVFHQSWGFTKGSMVEKCWKWADKNRSGQWLSSVRTHVWTSQVQEFAQLQATAILFARIARIGQPSWPWWHWKRCQMCNNLEAIGSPMLASRQMSLPRNYIHSCTHTRARYTNTVDAVFACVCCHIVVSMPRILRCSPTRKSPPCTHTCGWSFFCICLCHRDQEIQDETWDEIKEYTWDLELEWLTMTYYDYESLWITSNSSDSLVMSSHFFPSTLQAAPIFHTLDFPGNHGGWSGDKKWDGIGWGSGTHPKFVPLRLRSDRSATFSSPSYMLRMSFCKELLAKWDAEHVRRPRKGCGTSSRHLQLWSAIVCR